MSYKARIVNAAQEILLVEVKDISGPAKKIVSMAYETYLPLRKEMEMKILKIIQPGKPAEYAKRKIMELPSMTGEYPMAGKNTMPPAQKPSQNGNDKTYLPEDENLIPAPPAQNKQRLEDESDSEFRKRRMQEGKAYKAWERKYAKGNEGGGTPESSSASDGTRNVTEGEAAQVSAAAAGTPGDEATDPEFDPIKEAIERASHEQLEKKNQ